MEDLKFYQEQEKRIKEAIEKLDPARQTQKYINLVGCGTNLIGYLNQLEGLIKAKQEAVEREKENKKALKEAKSEMKKENK